MEIRPTLSHFTPSMCNKHQSTTTEDWMHLETHSQRPSNKKKEQNYPRALAEMLQLLPLSILSPY